MLFFQRRMKGLQIYWLLTPMIIAMEYLLIFFSITILWLRIPFNFSLEKKIRNVSVYWQNLC